jgi:hypothetical protein
VARYLKLRVREDTFLYTSSGRIERGDEFIVRFEDGAPFLREKGRRRFDVIEDFESDGQPDEVVSNRATRRAPG